jgi:hypothetical protein
MNTDLHEILTDFLHTLKEVDVLLSSAEQCVTEEDKYPAFNKSALLLLSGKFENFVEVLTEEYISQVSSLNLRSSIVPEAMKLHHSYAILSKVDSHKNNGKLDEVKQILNEIGEMWTRDTSIGTLNIECKFSYGKHGDKELQKLLAPIGIRDVFADVDVYVVEESIGDEPATKKVDFRGAFNSVVHMRNNILHQNASPSLTHVTVREYKLVFQGFAQALVRVLDNTLDSLIGTAAGQINGTATIALAGSDLPTVSPQ